MNEQYYDALLNIKTCGDQKGFNQSLHYHRYEPTSYNALKKLFQQYELKSSDRIIDFGCGKGRLNFFVHYLYNATAVGIEMNEAFYKEAIENKERYVRKRKNGKDKIHFHCCLAEEYEIDPSDNRFYFFNPFSIHIFRIIVKNILLSVEHSKREIELILYYSSNDYMYFLENETSFELKQEIKLPDHNPNERFLIYRLQY